MVEIILSVSNREEGRAYRIELDEEKSRRLIGRAIGEEINGDEIGLPGYRLLITGGTDVDGFPMRPDIPGSARKRVLLSRGPGFRPKEKGERRAKLVRGKVISDKTRQVNMVVVKMGSEPLSKYATKGEKKK